MNFNHLNDIFYVANFCTGRIEERILFWPFVFFFVYVIKMHRDEEPNRFAAQTQKNVYKYLLCLVPLKKVKIKSKDRREENSDEKDNEDQHEMEKEDKI